jgi:nucleoside-diphosphate-sugar epimerase
MKIVVTGSAGFIGSHLSERLIKEGHQVLGIDNFDPFYDRKVKESNLKFLLTQTNFKFEECDLAKTEGLPCIVNFKPDVIVHLAGKAGVRPSIEDPQGYIEANITATRNILDVMRKNSMCKLVFASSSSVYGNSPLTPYREDMDLSRPISPYAFTKKAAELLNFTYHELFKLDIVNLRFFTVYGPRQRPDLAIHKFVKLVKQGKAIPMFGDGSTSRDYTYYEDTVSGIVGAINYVNTHENVYEIFNLGNSNPVSLKDLIAAIGKATGINPIINQMPMQPGDVQITYADITRAKEILGYSPTTSIDKGLAKFVEWYDSQHN